MKIGPILLQHKVTIIILTILLACTRLLSHVSPHKPRLKMEIVHESLLRTPDNRWQYMLSTNAMPTTLLNESWVTQENESTVEETAAIKLQPVITPHDKLITLSQAESMAQSEATSRIQRNLFQPPPQLCLNPTSCQTETWITIFVHGILSIRPHLTFSMVLNLMQDKTEDTLYSATVDSIRKDPFFHKNQPMQEIGLRPIDMSLRSPSAGLSTILNKLYQSTAQKPTNNYFYTFGWSGILSPHERYREAKKFYANLAEELDTFTNLGITPKIRLFGYSHGGNLCLNLAAVKQRENIKKSFTIDETILLGVPIQEDSDHLVADSIFKRVYHFYSHADRVQQLDFFSFNRFFSHRTFKERRNFNVPQKLTQVQIQSFRRAQHKKDRLPKTDPTFDLNRPSIRSGTSPFLRRADPGHAELWFFGWTPNNYRKTFPLYPLPIVAIAPVIIKAINELDGDFSAPHNSLVVDIRPDQNVMLFKNSQFKETQLKPFLTDAELGALKQQAFRLAPVDRYTQQEYDTRVRKRRREIRRERRTYKQIAHAFSKKPSSIHA